MSKPKYKIGQKVTINGNDGVYIIHTIHNLTTGNYYYGLSDLSTPHIKDDSLDTFERALTPHTDTTELNKSIKRLDLL